MRKLTFAEDRWGGGGWRGGRCGAGSRGGGEADAEFVIKQRGFRF